MTHRRPYNYIYKLYRKLSLDLLYKTNTLPKLPTDTTQTDVLSGQKCFTHQQSHKSGGCMNNSHSRRWWSAKQTDKKSNHSLKPTWLFHTLSFTIFTFDSTSFAILCTTSLLPCMCNANGVFCMRDLCLQGSSGGWPGVLGLLLMASCPQHHKRPVVFKLRGLRGS